MDVNCERQGPIALIEILARGTYYRYSGNFDKAEEELQSRKDNLSTLVQSVCSCD